MAIKQTGFRILHFFESKEPGLYKFPAQPGIGKTYGLKKYIHKNARNPQFRIMVASNEHDHLDEIERDIKRESPEINMVHLRGFNKLCHRYIDGDEDVRTKYHNYGNPKENICEKCTQRSGCPYLRQFGFLDDDKEDKDKVQVVLVPLEFMNIPDLVSYVNQIVVDESIEKLTEFNIGVSEGSVNDMLQAVIAIGGVEETETLRKQIIYAYKVIEEFTCNCLKQGSFLVTAEKDVLETFNVKTKLDDPYTLQSKNGNNYITHPENIEPVLNKRLNKSINAFYANLEQYNEELSNIIKTDDGNILARYFIDFPGQIKAIQSLNRIYKDKQEQPFPITINEKIEYRRKTPPAVKKYDSQTIYYERKDGSCLISSMGKQYTSSEKLRKVSAQPDSWITFGKHMMHTVFEIAEYCPVKLLDSSFNETCFNKLYNENQSRKSESDRLPVFTLDVGITHRYTTHLCQQLTQVRGHKSNFPKSALGIADGGSPNDFCLSHIKEINALARQAKKEGKTVSMVTFKELEEHFIEPFGKTMIKHFNNFRGSNKQEEADIPFVFGTMFHSPKEVLINYIITFHEYPKDITSITDSEGRFKGYEDEELNEFFEWSVMENQYQAIHRSRGLIQDRHIIYYGKIPKRLLDNDEFTMDSPQRLRDLRAKLLNTKHHYLTHPEEARKSLLPNTDKFDFNWARKILQDGTLVMNQSRKTHLPVETVWEIAEKSFTPQMTLIKRTLKRWKKKEPNITNVMKAVQKKSRYRSKRVNGKVKKVKCKGYSRQEIYFAIAMLEREGTIKIKTIKWEGGRGGERKILILKT